MKATVMYKAGDVRVNNVPDARILNSKDALVRVTGQFLNGRRASTTHIIFLRQTLRIPQKDDETIEWRSQTLWHSGRSVSNFVRLASGF